jgi:hypothetical protein
MCENCRKREIFTDMDDGYAWFEQDPVSDDLPVVCKICGVRVESEKKDEHLNEVPPISI